MSGAKILIVDDETDSVTALRSALVHEDYEVLTARSGSDAIRIVPYFRPDLVILDLDLPDLEGSYVCRALRGMQQLALVPILFHSRRGSIEDRVNGLNSGADDYLVKPCDLSELKARISALFRRAARSKAVPSPNLAQLSYRGLSLDLRNHTVTVDNQTILLTPAEFNLLRHLLTHQGEVFSSEKLLQYVWNDPDATKDQGLVRWHVMRLRAKIEPDPTHPIYLRTVPRHGYMVGGVEG